MASSRRLSREDGVLSAVHSFPSRVDLDPPLNLLGTSHQGISLSN